MHMHRDNMGLPPEQQAVSAVPETKKVPISGKQQDFTFMVLACDGVWDVMECTEVGIGHLFCLCACVGCLAYMLQ
eukprot:scaffold10087_cov14-Tisochrysis_lutea.AAC.1